ncbi:MAG: hypothetical protein JXR95_12445 [Deltaproteobacteria bacterium]|nr:hypothetical protein [Deltaproteobacteria bacterium]
MKVFSILTAITLFFTVMSCEDGNELSDDHYKTDETGYVNDMFPEYSAESSYDTQECGPDFYPCPPNGVRRFQVLEDIPFIPVGSYGELLAGDDGVAWLHDFYAMRNDGKKLIYLTVSAGWCSVCAYQLPNLDNVAEDYVDEVIFLTIAQQDDSGYTADIDFAETYQNRYNMDAENVFVTADYNWDFYKIMNVKAFPFNAIINLETMEVIKYPDAAFSVSEYADNIESALLSVK